MDGMHTMSNVEYAWSSFDKNAQFVSMNNSGYKRIHVCQKPTSLYKWILKNHANPGDKIIDTHGGSMSIAIACYDLGFDLDLWEINKYHYDRGLRRYNNHIKQYKLNFEDVHV